MRRKADAATFAAQLWTERGGGFDSAARRLESGDIRGARSRADEAEALFRDAELTAIKAQYLSQTRALLAEADRCASRGSRRTPTRKRGAARASGARAQREPLRHRLAAQPRATSQLRSASCDLSREGPRRDARRGPLARGHHSELRGSRSFRSGRRPTRSCSSTRAWIPSSGTSRLHRRPARAGRAVATVDLTDSRKRIGELEEEIRDLDPPRRRVAGARRARAAARGRGAASASSSRRSRTCSSATRRASRAKATA